MKVQATSDQARSFQNDAVSATGEASLKVERGAKRFSAQKELVLIILMTVTVAAIADHLINNSIGIGVAAAYRRIGPTTGPQVFCVGSSLLQYSINWSEISEVLGQGIEHTNVAGSTPEIWEVFQRGAKNVNMTIIGISVYDLNEYRVSRGHAYIVPLAQTIGDLREAGASLEFSRRVLSEYPLAYLRAFFPTAGDSDAFLVGLRSIIRQKLGLLSAAEDRAIVLALPKEPILDFGKDASKLSALPHDRVLRRLSLLRSENRGMHSFHGPKQIALRRILERARRQGRVILVVLPVSSEYVREFLTPEINKEFEDAVGDALRRVPEATVVRLDRIPALQSDDSFIDFVHLNSDGRAIATQIVTEQIQAHP